MINTVIALIEFHEGRKAVPYYDTSGKLTAGVGHCLDTNPLPPDILALFAARGIDPRVGPWPDDLIDMVRDRDIADALAECWSIFGNGWVGFNAPRQAVMQDMAFCLGLGGLRKFSRMIAAAQIGNWALAAAEALSSDWATETPARAKMDAATLFKGVWPA